MMMAERQRFTILHESIYKLASSKSSAVNVLIGPEWTFSYMFSDRYSYSLSGSLHGKPFEAERMYTKAGHGFALEPFYD